VADNLPPFTMRAALAQPTCHRQDPTGGGEVPRFGFRVVPIVLGSLVVCVGVAWLRDRRIGSGFMNQTVNPRLIEHGLSGGRARGVGTIEHVGRVSGRRRLTPVHPAVFEGGLRIPVPLGTKSEWARNVLAAGQCRLQLEGEVYDLDEPQLLPVRVMPELGAVTRTVGGPLGFEFLRLHTVARGPGSLEPEPSPATAEA
jgi:hypothetical protein